MSKFNSNRVLRFGGGDGWARSTQRIPVQQNLPPHLSYARSLGNHGLQHLLRARALQAEMAVSGPGDSHEQGAERVARQVLRMPEPSLAIDRGAAVQRLCSERGEEVRRKPPLMREDLFAQGKFEDAGLQKGAPEIETYVNGLSTRGEPLAPAARAFFKPCFGVDFDAVRVHTGAKVSRSARSIQAGAYTTSDHIVFRAGRYDPSGKEGWRRLPHKLTHFVQQGGADLHHANRETPASMCDCAPQIFDPSAVATKSRLIA